MHHPCESVAYRHSGTWQGGYTADCTLHGGANNQPAVSKMQMHPGTPCRSVGAPVRVRRGPCLCYYVLPVFLQRYGSQVYMSNRKNTAPHRTEGREADQRKSLQQSLVVHSVWYTNTIIRLQKEMNYSVPEEPAPRWVDQPKTESLDASPSGT